MSEIKPHQQFTRNVSHPCLFVFALMKVQFSKRKNKSDTTNVKQTARGSPETIYSLWFKLLKCEDFLSFFEVLD